MKNFAEKYSHSMEMAAFGVWIFAVWRLAGMPWPGFMGRLIPAAWLLAACLNLNRPRSAWFIPVVLSFTAGAWLWMLYPVLWMIAAAIPVAGLIGWAISVAGHGGSYGAVRAVLPMILLSVVISEINGDEVRFAEQAAAVSGISSERFSELHFRTGDISPGEGHHTPLFPLIISPGLLAGDLGLRIIPAVLAILAVLLLAKLAGPGPAVAAALLYPGFGIFGLAMTGWLALGLFVLGVLLPEGGRFSALRLLIALFLVALKMRYIGLAGGILVAEYATMPAGKGKWYIPLIGITFCIMVLAVDYYFLNGVIFWRRYGNIEAVKLLWVNIFHRPLETVSAAGWSLFDPEAGLIPRAPWVLAAIPGLFLFRKKSPRMFKRLLIPSVAYWGFLIVWSGSFWHGLPAPVGRMFLPVLPLLACGLASVWNEKETRILMFLSVAVSAIVTAAPVCRYNYADGSDSILSLLGTSSGFSMVRSNSLLLLTALFITMSMMFVLRKASGKKAFLYLLLFASVFLITLNQSGYEAEDMPPSMVQGAGLYPEVADPVDRYLWISGRERLLSLSETGQSVMLRGVEPGDTMLLALSGNGGAISVGEKTLTVETPMVQLPSSFNFVGRTERTLPDWPENRVIETFAVHLDSMDVVNGEIRISHRSGNAVFFDRIDLSKPGEQ